MTNPVRGRFVRKLEQLAQISDEQLLAVFRAGDESAFARLVQRYEKELYNFLVRFLGRQSAAEDVFQETFLQVHISVDSFKTDRRFRPWLYTIAANKARDLQRQWTRRPTIQLTAIDDETGPSQLWDNLLQDDTTAADVLEQKQQKEVVQKVVSQLPDALREILILAYFNQLSYKEMAEVLDVPLGTVKSRLHAAVAKFAKEYTKTTQDNNR